MSSHAPSIFLAPASARFLAGVLPAHRAAGTAALPTSRLQHLSIIQAGHGQTFHRSDQVLAHFK